MDLTASRGAIDGATVSVLTVRPLPAFDYLIPEHLTLRRGDVVHVPLGRAGLTLGVVLGPGKGDVPLEKCKPVAAKFEAALPEVSIAFAQWVANYVLSQPGAVLDMILRVPQALHSEPPRVAYRLGERAAEKLTPARKKVLALAADGLARSPSEWAEQTGTSSAVVKGLIDAGVLAPVHLPPERLEGDPDPDFKPATLSEAQAAAADRLRPAVSAREFQPFLLDGVTGSGKTEAYFEAVAQAIRDGGQALVLLPEIALTQQFLARFERRFGAAPILWHSAVTGAQRRKAWRRVLTGEARVVAGARSALYLPYPDLRLIVIDEEHDGSFKQDEGVTYHARDMAVMRAKMSSCPIILASATPSLESWANAAQGRYERISLPERHGGRPMPTAALVDLKLAPPATGSYLSPVVITAVTETLAAGEQAMLFLNKRGFAPLTLCQACGHKFKCAKCDAWLVEHRFKRRLMCHHCGFDMSTPSACPTCKTSGSLIPCGPGVERIAEEAKALWPNIRTAIASSDYLQGTHSLEETISAVERHEIDLVIGTQLVAKGHNFPMLTLVAVVDGDMGLEGADPRARERTFQLLHQVAGRAGRADRPGRVLIQTHGPNEPVMQALAHGARDEFYAAETAIREGVGLPPFGRLAALILSGTDEGAVRRAGDDLAAQAPGAKGVALYGPALAPIAVVRGQTRMRLLVQAPRNFNMQAFLSDWLKDYRPPGGVRVSLDIDPQSFL
jgi:primosomal protein N' (replication factor Y) (superfamily II helicase)